MGPYAPKWAYTEVPESIFSKKSAAEWGSGIHPRIPSIPDYPDYSADPADPAEVVAATAIRTLPSTRARVQENESSKHTCSNYVQKHVQYVLVVFELGRQHLGSRGCQQKCLCLPDEF